MQVFIEIIVSILTLLVVFLIISGDKKDHKKK
jgi:hypothetical protein